MAHRLLDITIDLHRCCVAVSALCGALDSRQANRHQCRPAIPTNSVLDDGRIALAWDSVLRAGGGMTRNTDSEKERPASGDGDENPFVKMSVGGNIVGAIGTLIIVFVVLPVVVWILMSAWEFIFG